MKAISVKTLSLIVLATCWFQISTAQNRSIEKGIALYNEQAYPMAIQYLTRGLKKLEDGNARSLLANSYEEIGNYSASEAEWKKLAEGNGAKPEWLFNYGRLLKMGGKYAMAKEYFEKYRQTGHGNVLAQRSKQSCDLAMDLMKDSTRYKISHEPFSGKASDMGPFITRTGVMFASTRPRGFCKRVLNMRNNDYFYDIYNADRSTKTKNGWQTKPLKGKVNSRFHEGPAVLSNDGNTLYFTRSNYSGGKRKTNGNGVNTLQIYSAKRVGKKWKDVEVLSFCSPEYSTGHPALSADGLTMYFSSNRPGGFGGSDLYRVSKEGNGWGEPENLGPGVNSLGEDLFPTLAVDGSLLFSSDGHPGMGGLDIFIVSPENGRFGEVRNAGYPLNGPTDDFAVSLIKGKAKGFFSSDRKGGSGKDDIYSFERKMVVQGTVVDASNGKPLQGAVVELNDGVSTVTSATSDAQGKFQFPAEFGKEYMIIANAKDFLQGRVRLEADKLSPLADPKVEVKLEPDLYFEVFGKVVDAGESNPLSNTQLRMKKVSGSSKNAYSGQDGKYNQRLELETDYTVFYVKEGYVPQIKEISTVGKTKTERFEENITLQKGRYILLEGEVVKKDNQQPVPNAVVHSIDVKNRREIMTTHTNSVGQFNAILDPAIEQILLVSSDKEYFTARYEVPGLNASSNDTTIYPRIELVPWEVGQLVKIIYYDYNKSDITLVASKDLFEIVYFLKDNPEASVELGSHTDSRGSDSYNQNLSQGRSDAAVEFIVSQGIEQNRIAAKGYGESKLVNGCKDGVECTEEQHSENRRTEIRITEINNAAPKATPLNLFINKDRVKQLEGK